jgi:HJR/Mrr/RecB family endonuclease
MAPFGSGPFGSGPFGGEFEAAFDIEEPVQGESPLVVASRLNHALIARLHCDEHALRTLDRRFFEELVAELFQGFGYDVELTQQTRDGGKDIIAVRRREVDVRFLIECKRPDPGNPVRVSTVRELLGVKHSEGATKAILATTSFLSPDARVLVEKHRWELEAREYEAVREWIAAYLSGGSG